MIFKKKLVVIGAGGHAVSIAETAQSAGFKIAFFVDPKLKGMSLFGVPVMGDITEIKKANRYCYCIAVGDNYSRYLVSQNIKKEFSELNFPVIVHKSAVVSKYASVEEGTVVMIHALVGAKAKVGRFCILNTRASIDHESCMGDFSSLGPGVVVGGNVQIGSYSAICIGAVVKHSVSVGENSVLGASSYLNTSLGDNLVAYGVPAKVVRERVLGERYL